jgi:4-hydroxy-3-polyprenylbenzoate decarboxylase
MPGVLAVEETRGLSSAQGSSNSLLGFPLIVLCDDSQFVAASLANFLWVTFTRANPATDVYGVGEFSEHKHWGCTGPLIIDARIKPHHAPPLATDAETCKRIDALAARGGPLARWL